MGVVGIEGNGWWSALSVLDLEQVGFAEVLGEIATCSLHAGQQSQLSLPPGLAPLGGAGGGGEEVWRWSPLVLHNLPPGCSGLEAVI